MIAGPSERSPVPERRLAFGPNPPQLLVHVRHPRAWIKQAPAHWGANHMKMKIAAAGVLAALGVGFVAIALEGAYVAPSGTKVTFSADSVHVELSDGTAFDVPTTTEGDTITFNAAADDPTCPGQVGTYTVAESDAGVTFTAVSDDCEARRTDLTAGAWTKAAEAAE
jgi:hypothetical protein